MIAIAKKKNKKHINSGKVKIRMGDFTELPFDDNCFDKIFSVNTIYYWKDPKATILKIFDLLKPGSKLVLGFHDKNQMEKMSLNKDVVQFYTIHEVTELLSIDGSLNNVQIISQEGQQNSGYCAVGAK